MKVYVDKLPKDCIDCPFCQDIKVNAGMDRLLFCKANKGKAIKNIEKSFDKCIVKNEFQSLTDYTKQVRKEVVEEIREKFNTEVRHHFCPNPSSVDFITLSISEVEEFLDQVKGENNGRKIRI